MGEWDTGNAETFIATMPSEEDVLTKDPVREKITDLEARIQELECLLREKDMQAQSASSSTTPQGPIPDIAESVSANGIENRTSVQAIDKLTAVQNAIRANKAHQQALQARSALLKAELSRADNLFAQVDRDVDEDVDELSVDVPDDWAIFVAPGGTAARPVISKKQICLEDSPFLEDAARYKRYVSLTTPHTFNSKERTALAAALRSENMRLYAIELGTSGVSDPLEEVRKQPDSFYESQHEGVDWRRIADQVNTASQSHFAPRSAQDCKTQWVGSDQPSLVKTSEWDVDDDERLETLVGGRNVSQGEVDWVDVASSLGNTRTPAQCLSRYLYLEDFVKTDKEKTPWTAQEDAELQKAVSEHGNRNWRAVAVTLSTNRTPAQCATRYRASLNPAIKRGSWTSEEDALLKQAVALYGTSWTKVKELVKGRTGPQCRERYCRSVAVLNAASKGRWKPEEDERLREAVNVKGLKDWSDVAKYVGTRLEQQCFKRWAIFEANGTTKWAKPVGLEKRRRRQKTPADEDTGSASDSKGGEGDPPENVPIHQASSPEPSAVPPKTKRKQKTPSKSDKNDKVAMKGKGSSLENAEGGPTATPSLEETPKSEAKKNRPRPKPKPRFTQVTSAEDGGGEPSLEEGTSSTKAIAVAPIDTEIATEQSAPDPAPTKQSKTIRKKGKKSAISRVSGSLVPESGTAETPPSTAAPRPRTRSMRKAALAATASMSSTVAQWEVQNQEDTPPDRVSPARDTSSVPAVLPSIESNGGIALEEVEEQEESEDVQVPIAVSRGLAPLPAGFVTLSTPDRSSALHGLAEAAVGAPRHWNEIPEISERAGKRTAEEAGLDEGIDVDQILSTRAR